MGVYDKLQQIDNKKPSKKRQDSLKTPSKTKVKPGIKKMPNKLAYEYHPSQVPAREPYS